ncbi:MAG: DNA-binding protein [Elusimicrobia bacterium]|nr:MAG: DNA-binding protein [Elusimicrobiota bacterium]
MANENPLAPADEIGRRIFLIRGKRMMLDSDLAAMYGVPTHRLNEQVRRNAKRFPADFMFQLVPKEFKSLISQFAISKKGRGGQKKLPLVFTQEGVGMLSGVLHSPRAILVNIAVIRAFVGLREIISTHGDLAERLWKPENESSEHGRDIRTLFEVIHEFMNPPESPRPRIGFKPK